MKRHILGLLFCIPLITMGQEVEISRFVPGNASHYIDLFNPSVQEEISLEGYLLITREYAIQFPANLRIAPLSVLRLGYKLKTSSGIDIDLSKSPALEEREKTGPETGNFAFLQNPQGRTVDAFYFNRERSVSFLPVRDVYREGQEGERSINLPDEKNNAWNYMQLEPDPAMAFVRINHRWRINSRRRNLIPATKYRSLQARFVEGIMTIRFNTTEENDCFFHFVERSRDGVQYSELGSLRANGNSRESLAYTFYDPEVEKNRTYYYRIKNVDKFGQIVYSNPFKVRTTENPDGFNLEISRDLLGPGYGLNVRFASTESQRVQVKILDEEYREIVLLYYGEIEANRQNLLTYAESLPIGKYFVVLATNDRRYIETFIVD
ncbi:MAG: hypothetical protein AAF927_02460 [Bacteroidota bacterium]